MNKHEIWEMKQFVEQELGLEFKFDAMMNPRIDCSRDPLAVRLTPEEIVGLDLLDPGRVAAWHSFAGQFNGPAHSPAESDELYHCGGGIHSFAIDPHGRLSICMLSRSDSYDLRRGSFREGWREFLLQARRGKITRLTKCILCEIKAMCGMCPANGELEQGDPESPVDFLCQVAHLRSHVLGIPVPAHGDCEYCDGGVCYPELMDSTTRLQESCSRMKDITGQNIKLTSELSGDRPAGADGRSKRNSCSCHLNSQKCTHPLSTPNVGPGTQSVLSACASRGHLGLKT